MAATSPQHFTLTANTPTTATFDVDYAAVEVLNVDGSAEVYFTADGTAPTIGGTGCHVLPAAIGAVEVRVNMDGPTVVKLISTGTPKVSVRTL